MRVLTGTAFYYPDVMVVCGAGDPARRYQTEPMLFVGALSGPTEARNRREKLVAYQGLPSLQEYPLAAQEKAQVELHRRLGKGWQGEVLSAGETVRLGAVGFEASVERFYEDVLGPAAKPGTAP
jgi:Uma2 family endonuclease